jgi:ribosome-associated heat shock protein Hsp15
VALGDGAAAKPATPVRLGDRVEAHVHGWRRDVEAAQLLTKRVGAPAAAEAYVDHNPVPPERDPYVPPLFPRDDGAGRPTKRDRRLLDRLRKPAR